MWHPRSLTVLLLLSIIACDELGLPSSSTSIAGLIVSPEEVDFGEVKVGETASQEVKLLNESDDIIIITNGTILPSSGSVNNFFFDEEVSFPLKISPSSTESFNLIFSPSDEGDHAGRTILRMKSGDEANILLSGKGYVEEGDEYPDIEVSPTLLDFGYVVENTTSTLSFTIKNSGGVVLDIDGIYLRGSNVFSFPSSFSNPFDLDPQEEVAVDVSFTPTDVLSYSATLIITSNDPVEPSVEVLLKGSGEEEPCPSCTPDIYVDTGSISGPLSLVFITPAGGSDYQTFLIENVGTADLYISSITEGLLTSPEFSITVNPAPTTVPPGGSTAVTINYHPTDTIPDLPYQALDMNIVHIYSNDTDENPLDIELWGTAF